MTTRGTQERRWRWVETARRWVPQRLRFAIQRVVSMRGLKLRRLEALNPLAGVLRGEGRSGESAVRFGIVRNAAQYHTHFVQACLDLDVPFVVIDLFRSDWLEQVAAARCDVLLVWPDAVLTTWNTMLKDRVTTLVDELGYASVPTPAEIWMYEDKRRMSYWLAANEIPHPRTWVFYERSEAMEFCDRCELPVVFKTCFGAASTGVRILRSRGRLRALVRKAFSRGIAPGGLDWRDRQWGSVLLQEYLPDVREWRVVRIGDSFLCRFKEKLGDFHSGSGLVRWARPTRNLLDFARSVTDRGAFRSMAVDVFETVDGRLLVNELQAVFGPIRESNLERGAEHRGRWCYDMASASWTFEAGDYYRNACANERILDALARGVARGAPRGSRATNTGEAGAGDEA
ncbi:MAG TPA: hypothetical protein PLL76_21235 [Thermoanaerobaculia bacterium]|nr:hypothetical protein [Thermoanaerobaculia bacterium]